MGTTKKEKKSDIQKGEQERDDTMEMMALCKIRAKVVMHVVVDGVRAGRVSARVSW